MTELAAITPKVEAVARRLAYDEWPLATEAERASWAEKHWGSWTWRAERAIEAMQQADGECQGKEKMK